MKKSDTTSENHNCCDSSNSISRRHFLKNASATAAAGTAGLAGIGSVGCLGKIKTVKLRRTDMTVSKFLGDRMADRKLYELALASGVNYWHKFGHWA
ncbi:twin-arginine translocation signal domain-containing protein, partial [Candidatus Latescibacterota bacterium]